MENRVGRFMSFLAVCVGLSVWGAVVASSQTLSLDDQTAAAVGDRVTFSLSIDYPASESGEIQAVTIDVNFDQTVLTPETLPDADGADKPAHTRGSLVENWQAFDVSNPQEGQLRAAGLTFTAGDGIQPGDSGAIVQLHFIVASMADATLAITAHDALADFTVRDGQFTFELPPANNPPMPTDDMGTTEEDTAVMLDVLGNDEDADGENLTITAVTQGANGAVAITDSGATVTYTPNAGFTGLDEFTYTVSDGTDEASATVMVTVTEAPAPPPVNAEPVATDDEAETDEGESVTIDVLANDSDPDGDRLTITMVTQSSYGSVSISADGTSVTYVPDADFSGEDQFMYTVSDGEAADTATVMVDVLEVDDGGDTGNVNDVSSGGGGGCTLNPGGRFDPTLIVVLAFLLGVHCVRQLARRRALR